MEADDACTLAAISTGADNVGVNISAIDLFERLAI
jgi:hypothetical protein